MNPENPYKTAYRAEIDGLRAFAVLSVVAFHAFPNLLNGGFIGVDVFFVISGFLITSHIFERLGEGKFSFTDFFSRRIRRIFPALIVVMTASLFFGSLVLLADEYAQLGKHIASGSAFILNFVLVNESGYFDNSAETKPMLHLWSLAVEEQFYIIWPLVLWLAWKCKFNLLAITILVAVASFYFNLKFVNSKPTETFFWSIGRFWELLSGSILAWLLVHKGEWLSFTKLWIDKYIAKLLCTKNILNDGSTVSNLMSFFGLWLLVYSTLWIHEGVAWPSTWALIPIIGALLVISAGSKAWCNRVLLMNPIAVWFGLISYPLYLWHWPILSYLRIIEGELPHRDARIAAVLVSVALAWTTYKFIESPIRYGRLKIKINAFIISLTIFLIGVCGYFVSTADLSETHGYEDMVFTRKGFEHAFGNSLKWFEGKDDWLFLGNAFANTVAKQRLAVTPTEDQIKVLKNHFLSLVNVASASKTKVALLAAPNKSSVYSEFLPDELVPSEKRYSTFFTDELRNIPNLVVHDPIDLLHRMKTSEGLLYYRTDSHWNAKGAFIAYSSLLKRLGLPGPRVEFKQIGALKGDLIEISKLNSFPMHSDDNWQFVIDEEINLVEEEILNQPKTPFGPTVKVKNFSPINEMKVWVIGDSFSEAFRPYLNLTFKEVHYLGHSSHKLKGLHLELQESEEKPDLIIVVIVERGF